MCQNLVANLLVLPVVVLSKLILVEMTTNFPISYKETRLSTPINSISGSEVPNVKKKKKN